MDTLPLFRPSTEPTAYQTVGYVRQNAWKKTKNFLELVYQTKKLHAPHGHQKEDVTLWNTEQRVNSQYAKTLHGFDVGDLVLVPNGDHGILVQIKAMTKAGVIPGAILVLNATANLTAESHGRDDVVAVISCYDGDDIKNYLAEGKKVSGFYSVYREIEVVGRADYNGVDGRALAGMDSAGLRKQYWARV